MAIADVSAESLADLVSLSGRTAVVTGASRGIGLAIARRLAEAGAAVALGDLTLEHAQDAAGSISGSGLNAVQGYELDMRREESVEAFMAQTLDAFGSVDIWVNNAGIYPSAPLLEISGSAWSDVLDLNLKGTFLGARAAAAHMIDRGSGGVIVNVASTTAFRAPGPGITHYTASKFGIRGLTKALAVELGVHGIRVLAVAPTFIDTPGTRRGQEDTIEQKIQIIGSRLPLGRAGVPDDVARVVLFCASDLATLMTGSTLPVDAGELAL